MTPQNPHPKVTVIVPGFNTAPYLTATFNSVRAQTFQDYEVIMVDDGSTDGTLAIMQKCAADDARCKVISLQSNQGVVAARNAALAHARGEFIAMLDGDDLWTPDALAVRLDVALRYPMADVVATNFAWFENEPSVNPTGRIGLGPRAKKAFAHSFGTLEPTVLEDPFELVATTHFAWTGATLVRSAAMAAIGNFDTEFKGPEDTLLWLRLAQRGAFAFAPQITAFYRQRAGSLVTLQKGPKELHYLKVLQWVHTRPDFASHIRIILQLEAECHHISAVYYRRQGDCASASRHAVQAVKAQPRSWKYWRDLAATFLQVIRQALHLPAK